MIKEVKFHFKLFYVSHKLLSFVGIFFVLLLLFTRFYIVTFVIAIYQISNNYCTY